jgi:uncharacterized repeat protein (TIGR01451 family)
MCSEPTHATTMRWFQAFARRLRASTLFLLATGILAAGLPSGAAGSALVFQSRGDGGAVADLEVDNSDSRDPVRVGENFHYSIRIRDLGPGDATGVQMTDTLPESFELVDATGAKSCARDGEIHCDLGDIAHDGNATVILHVRASKPGRFTNTATAWSTIDDPNRENNSDSEATEISGEPDPSPTSHVIVVDHVVNDNGGKAQPGDLALAVKGDSTSPAQFRGAAEPGTDVTLAAGPYEVSQETALGYLTTLSSECSGTVQPGDTKTCIVSNDDVAPITLAIGAEPASVQAGGTTRYTVAFANANARTVAVSNLRVTLPEGFSYRAGSASGTTTNDPQIAGSGSAQTLIWPVPVQIAAAGSESLNFSASASATPGTYSAQVQGTVDAPFTLHVTPQASPVIVVAPDGSAPSPQPSQDPGQGQTSTTTTTTTTSTTGTPTTPTTAPPPASVPPPVFEKNADVEPVSGEVLVRPTGTRNFVPLTTATRLAFGSEIDATDGRVNISTVDSNGTLYHADFFEGRFLLRNQSADAITVLQLSGGDFASCKKAPKRSLALVDKKPRKSKHKGGKKKSKKVVRHLWGTGTGKFRTRGRYIAATVQGTRWLTEDRCDGTRAFVAEGVVAVRDLVRHKTIRLGAGRSYLARPR